MSRTSNSIGEKFPASKFAPFTPVLAFKNCRFCTMSDIVGFRWSKNALSEMIQFYFFVRRPPCILLINQSYMLLCSCSRRASSAVSARTTSTSCLTASRFTSRMNTTSPTTCQLCRYRLLTYCFHWNFPADLCVCMCLREVLYQRCR